MKATEPVPEDSKTPEEIESSRQFRFAGLLRLSCFDRKLIEVVPGVHISSVVGLIFTENLKAAGITHIISLMQNAVCLHVFDYVILGLDKTSCNSYIRYRK